MTAADPVTAAVEVLFDHRHNLPPDAMRSLVSIWICASAARYGEPGEALPAPDELAAEIAAHDTAECEAGP